MYHKKKIALFISHIYGEYQGNLCQGVVNQAEDYGYQTEIYISNDGERLGDYIAGEHSILLVPSFSDFDGIIFASGTYRDAMLKDQICQRLLAQKECPVVEITEYDAHFPSISLDNNLTTGTLTEHLILVHQCKRICYLGSLNDRFFSDRRQLAFENTMGQHGMELSDSDIYLSDGSNEDYLKALDQFTRSGSSLPDAVVCYNDAIAIQFWLAANSKGYEIPKDFALVGCDCLEEGQNFDPPLTTVTFPAFQVGQAAVDSLISLSQGKEQSIKTVFAKPVYAGSCGCNCHKDHPSFVYSHSLQGRIADLEESTFTSMEISAAFSHASDLDSAMELLSKYVLEIGGYKEFYLCLYSDWDNLSTHVLELTNSHEELPSKDSIFLALAVKNDKRLPECSFSKTALLPEYLLKESTSSFVVIPLFFEQQAFGYVAISFQENRIFFPFKLVPWFMNISQLLHSLKEAKRTEALTKHLEEIYMKDALTGLYNHHGFSHQEKQYLKKCKKDDLVIALLFDLDMLKTINDHFGHEEGDFALKGIGQALKATAQDGDICARFSGDEFYCLIHGKNEQNAKDFILRVEKYLMNYNKLSSKPYNISTSGGYALCDFTPELTHEDIKKLFAQADANMYQAKKNKVKHVLVDEN